MNIKLYSQYLDVTDSAWHHRACGVAALKNMMSLRGVKKTPSIDALIKEGVEGGAYIPGVGWRHKGLVELAAQYGFSGDCFDWFREKPSVALQNLNQLLKDGPVIASIHHDLDPKNNGHLVVVEDVNGSVRYHDSAAQKRRDITKIVSVEKFLDGWKRRAITIRIS